MADPHFPVVISSIRPHGIGPDVAGWVAEVGREAVSATVELVDLREWTPSWSCGPSAASQATGHQAASSERVSP